MSKNGKSSLTPKAKEAAKQFSAKAFAKALRIDKFGPQMETQVADLCHEAWAAGYFYAKQEKNLTNMDIKDFFVKREMPAHEEKPNAEQYAPLYKEPEDVILYKVVRKLVELGAEFDINACGLHITNTNYTN